MPFVLGGLDKIAHGGDGGLQDSGGICHLGEVSAGGAGR
jgi:hypothetical protein